jgi:ribosome biogenesis GTPase / thiamine phosphate phosphatase
MTLTALGWNEVWRQKFYARGTTGSVPGRVVSEHRTHYRVATDETELTAEITGHIRHAARQRSDLPGVGDFVALQSTDGDGPASIHAVLPRSTELVRKAAGESRPQLLAANVDHIFIVIGLDGDFNLQRIERYVALVRSGRSVPIILANKVDLSNDVAKVIAQIAAAEPGVPIHAISARNGGSLADLDIYFEGGMTVALIGSSGVGKSTLTNQLLGRSAQATQDVRAHDSRGRHTTTHRQLFVRERGGTIIDTPGMRGLELWNEPAIVPPNFEDIEALAMQCRFRNCRHQSEPGCAVRAAIERHDLEEDHLADYAKPRGRCC